jgi:hypothetical protein
MRVAAPREGAALEAIAGEGRAVVRRPAGALAPPAHGLSDLGRSIRRRPRLPGRWSGGLDAVAPVATVAREVGQRRPLSKPRLETMNGTTKFIAHLDVGERDRVAAHDHVELVDRGEHDAHHQRDAQRATQVPPLPAVTQRAAEAGVRGGRRCWGRRESALRVREPSGPPCPSPTSRARALSGAP